MGLDIVMSKIAYDLDGVLVPDYNQIPNLTQAEFYQQTLYAKPMFNPTGIFDVVTARDEIHRPVTEHWLTQLATPPNQLFMKKNDNESNAEYKLRLCLDQGYRVYVESDAEIVDEMTKLNDSKLVIIHFGTYIVRHFNQLAAQNNLFNFIKK